MQLLNKMGDILNKMNTYRETIDAYDILEILIIAFLVYYILVWLKTTRAWQLMKGLIVICVFLLFAYSMKMTTIIWLAQNLLSISAIAIIVVMQPELRHALEELGKKNFLPSGMFSDTSKIEHDHFSEKTINEIVKACYEMGKVRTGALIVIEGKESLREYERTGIEVDGIVTSQLLINIFEHNTPLHDGAVIVRGNRIVSATCYLPLSDSLSLSKDLGTRHRAAVGISEVSDSMTIVVSEETGKVSIAIGGELYRNVDADFLKNKLTFLQKREMELSKIELLKRRLKDAKNARQEANE